MKWFNSQFVLMKIPWRINKLFTGLYIVIRVVSGILPSLYILTYSNFINTILGLYSGNIKYHELYRSFLAIAILTLFNYLSSNLSGYISMKLRIKITTVVKMESLEKRSRLRYEYIENKESQDLIYRTLGDMPEQITKGFFNLFDLVELTIKIASITAVITTLSLLAGIIILICFIPIILVSIHSGEEGYDSIIKFQEVQRRLDNYENVLVSKEYVDERLIYNYSSWFTQRWKETYKQAIEIFLGIKKKNYVKVKVTSLIITIIFMGIIFLLMKLTLEGVITLGLFTATVMQLLELGGKISWTLSSIIYQLANTNSYMKDYLSFYKLEEDRSRHAPLEIKNIESIEFQNVSFKYPGSNEYTLKNLSIKLNIHETYAIVGENGAGKTSLIKLLLKLYDEYDGRILINGVDLREIRNVNSLFSVVFQDYAKYEISIIDNILFDNKDNMENEKLLSLFEYLNFSLSNERFSSGIYTEIGRLSGMNTDLSSGQWQKLALIRALEQEGNYYILDEPTAALDPIAEATIYRDFIKILKGKPAIIITHRLGAARLADKIIVLNKGTIVESGTHKELLSNNGLYKEMHENQRMWYVDGETTILQDNAS